MVNIYNSMLTLGFVGGWGGGATILPPPESKPMRVVGLRQPCMVAFVSLGNTSVFFFTLAGR